MSIENDLRESRDQAIPPAEAHFIKGEEYLKAAERLMLENDTGSSAAGERFAILATAHFAAASADRNAVTAGWMADIQRELRSR